MPNVIEGESHARETSGHDEFPPSYVCILFAQQPASSLRQWQRAGEKPVPAMLEQRDPSVGQGLMWWWCRVSIQHFCGGMHGTHARLLPLPAASSRSRRPSFTPTAFSGTTRPPRTFTNPSFPKNSSRGHQDLRRSAPVLNLDNSDAPSALSSIVGGCLMGAEVYGDAASSHTEGDSSPIASETSTNMSWPIPADAHSQLPPRPALTTQQSSSVPATPFHHPRGLRFPSRSHSRSPSPNRRSSSPRSAHSELNHILPLRKQYGGCKYETAMAHFRRRMPYSLGADLLPEEQGPLKDKLAPEDEERLTSHMKELYKKLLPSAESEQRRIKFVKKLENLLNTQWPGNDIKVHVFGSSGNKLCSSDSDELEHVCLLADFLAKIPIVKIWDPELQVACDMNVNNTMALENTRMIRTYVEVDERVRPLAMIVKHWTKQRILNDAALGGTLSSYTWICLIINFLQTRSPPIVPSLQKRAISRRKQQGNGQSSSSFDDNLEELASFGHKNKSTLGELLFQFFRYYGHEVDYEKNVMSVREGKLVSKEGKGWHLLQNNRLCVEEPFNTSRNLGNTADDTSFRGLHLELRRAFEAVAIGDLGKCCERYEYPPEEERTWERPAPQPRAILTPMPALPSRGGRGGGRGGRHTNHYHRGPNNMGRRASNTANRNNIRSANPSFTADIAFQAQQAQSILHDHLYQRIQILQKQEQELRMQLQNQALMTGRAPPTLLRQPYLQFTLPQHENISPEENPRVRASSVNQPPLTAPIRQNVFFNTSYVPVTLPGVQGTNTNPPSPSLPSAVPDVRRSHRRSSVANDSPRGLRAQSQPARPVPSVMLPNFPAVQQDMNSRRSPECPPRSVTEGESYLPNGVAIPKPTFGDENLPSEFYTTTWVIPRSSGLIFTGTRYSRL
ncbi:Poly(A) RNA polymerase cid13 [Coccidioides immitis RMSCC 3703]|uniref:polynucleotide adenylyltransferase n=1 Tax=Coccidioides immitis RMSCC 3703 TaxID=454286 RepID=A0A0J8QJQ1_COCIT|nr:Poly(A) RNA polymerase cid13 [Coccidioides immitis RMSCC 3703]